MQVVILCPACRVTDRVRRRADLCKTCLATQPTADAKTPRFPSAEGVVGSTQCEVAAMILCYEHLLERISSSSIA